MDARGPDGATAGGAFDALTEGAREAALMAAVRGGRLAPEDLPAAGLSFPVKLQLQTASPCNAACVMCPWPDTGRRLPQGRMEPALFTRVVGQIAGRGVERTSLFLMNEPLLDERLEDFTAELKAADPHTRATIITNGTRLTAARASALARAGMDEISVSMVGFDARSHAETMGIAMPFEQLLEQLGEVAALAASGALGGLELRVIGLAFPRALQGLHAFRERVALPVFLKPVSNRAGSVDSGRLDAPPPDRAHFSACQRPFVKAYVLYNGDLVLCNCDWERSTILGNLAHDDLETLWNGPELTAIRRAHVRGAPPADSLCSRCDYPYLGASP